MFSKEVRIDLGTANLLMYVKGGGIVIDEPGVVAINAETKKYLAAGQDARGMLGRTPGRVLTIRPLKDGVIVGFEVTEIMPNFFLKELAIKGMFERPTILICYPSNIASMERNAIHDTAYRAGAKKMYIEEEPKVATVGTGPDIGKPSGCMVLDIDGGMTDVAVISLGKIVSSTSLKITGDMLDRDIIKFVKENKKLLTGDRTAKEVRKRIRTAWKDGMHEAIEVSGRDLVTGPPTTITLSNKEVQSGMAESLQGVVRACRTVLEQIPPKLASDIMTRSIVLTSGGTLLHDIGELLRNELHIPVYVAENALRRVAEGTGILLENLRLIQ